jgi:methionine sulfoxide reductase heme-binding subunit
MILLAAAHGPSALWYATRGTGAVTLVLLTASVVLGIAETRGWRPARVSLFAVGSLHRTLSLLAVGLLVVHIVTTLLDPFPHIGVLIAVIPFVDPYRQLWLGLGTVAADLLLALVITSLVRRRLGYRAWRGVHWFAYACWPIALLHGLGTGSDARTSWMLLLTIACVGSVLIALAGRLAAGHTPVRARLAGSAAAAGALLALVVWAAQGPLAKGWAGRAGTPRSVLTAFAPPRTTAVSRTRGARRGDAFDRPFSADLRGVVRRGQSSDGTAVVDLRMRFTSGPSAVLRVRLGGQALADGGLVMKRSAVTFGPPDQTARYRGRVSALRNTTIRALVGSSRGRAVDLTMQLSLQGDTVSGALHGTPVEASSQ